MQVGTYYVTVRKGKATDFHLDKGTLELPSDRPDSAYPVIRHPGLWMLKPSVKKVNMMRWKQLCLVEKGDVAFVPHTAIFENTDGKNTALWAKDLKSTDFELLCPDGSRAPVSDYKKCKISGIANQVTVTRPESVKDVVRITQNQQSLYGQAGSQKDMFQMFSSSYGQNLLFNDRTQCLFEFDRMLDRDIMDDYFSKPFQHFIRDNDCLPKSALASACSFHH
ncbi:unnamed protein product [Ranitomeya imitator]|uniref:Transferrin-like domain-containing protein n=1 Tax=Ranitomeya imitator TaxID=111125 RepID=A0ABN9LKK7_9NEOB|nr:unnamed protein product [Ranitomeya imitator]